jgi:anti-sigma regulatory factor (Ser/Thr protein kinase)
MISISRKPMHLQIRLPATLESIITVAETTKQFLTDAGKTQEIFGILLMMHEALANAIVHGCHGNPRATVTYSLWTHGQDIIMEIEDEGAGFDWTKASAEEVMPGACADHGRGLCIIRNYASSYRFNQKGNKITITCASSTEKPETEKPCTLKNQ